MAYLWSLGYCFGVFDALGQGAAVYHERSETSALKKRDGALKDALKNWSKAFTKSAKIAAKAPNDVLKKIDTKPLEKSVRRTARDLSIPMFR